MAASTTAHGEIPEYIRLDFSRLHAADGVRRFLRNLSKCIHRSVDDMTVEPCDALANDIEDNLMGDEHIKFVPIETMVGCSP